MKPARKDFFVFLVVSSACGALAGFAAGMWSAQFVVETGSPVIRPSATTTRPLPPTSTTTFALVPVERRAAASLAPPAFASRGSSDLASIYRKPKAGTTIEERLLSVDKLLGQAVALTADGWFVTSAGVLEGLHPSDVVVWHDGASYAVERATLDRLNDTVFLKTNASGLSAPAFGHVAELSPAAGVWIEPRPGELAPSSVLDLGSHASPNDAIASEVAGRRIVLAGQSGAADRGGAVWDPSGSLLGVVESKAGEAMRLIPASTIAAGFSSLLSDGAIRHAFLGARAIDLAALRMDAPRGHLPLRGAWIHDDKKSGKPALVRDGPAIKSKLQSGDVILRVERDILDGTADLGEILSDYRPGTTVTLRIARDGSDLDIPVMLGTIVTSESLK